MEDYHNLSAKFKNLLKETEKVTFDYIDSIILQKPSELLELKAVYSLNTIARLEHCYLLIELKIAEQRCNSMHPNSRQSAQLIYHYRTLYEKAAKEGDALYLRIHQKYIATFGSTIHIITWPQAFAFNVRFFGDCD